ncbi:MAG: agmatinase [Alphaproteobacteria bacterium]|nr:agmatinase [Alphaproteobacteria bacterium]
MIKLIGIPYDSNSSFLKGPSFAPPIIRLMDSNGSANNFSEQGIEILEGTNFIDLKDMNFNGLNSEETYVKIKNKIQHELNSNDKIISFGGDHSISFPIIESYLQKYQNLNILQLDAHCDLYDNFNNNPYSHASPFARIMEKNSTTNLTQVGIRTLNTHQKNQALKYHVNIIEMKNFNFDFINALKGPLYISLDLDVLDPAFAPGVSHHEPGGLSTRELLTIIQNIPVNIVGADIVEYNPIRDVNNMTAMVAYKLFKELANKMID